MIRYIENNLYEKGDDLIGYIIPGTMGGWSDLEKHLFHSCRSYHIAIVFYEIGNGQCRDGSTKK